MNKLISRQEALSLLFEKWTPPAETQTVPLTEAAGRVPVGEYRARHSIPVVRASCMDGVAVDAARFAGGIPDTSHWKLGKDYVRADTGDDFDDRFDAVIRIEDVSLLPAGGFTLKDAVAVTPGMNVRGAGSTLKRGTKLIHSGLPLRATDLAALAMGAFTEVAVRRKPRVAFIPTGSELIPIGAPLGRGQNYDTNSLMAQTMLLEMGAQPICHPIVPDDPQKLRAALHAVLPNADVVIINGGSSRGDEDYNTRLLAQEGELLFHGVAAGPGRPMGIALIGGKPVINIAGPALGAFYSLHWCIKPIVFRFLGLPLPAVRTVQAELTREVHSAPPMDFLNRVEITRKGGKYYATPMGRGQADLPAMLRTNAMFISPVGESFYPAGSVIEAELLRDESMIPDWNEESVP